MSKEAIKLALEALRKARRKVLTTEECHAVIMSIKEALAEQPAQQEAKIVRWNCPCGNKYTFHGFTKAPPQRTWVGLTDEEIDQGLLRSDYAFKTAEAWRAGVVFAMTKLKEKNT